jgi:hypothetical protein
MFLSSNDIIVLSHCFNIPFKFTVKGKICGYSPYKNRQSLEASAALVILELSERMLPTDPLTLAIWPSIASLIHRFF